MSELNGKPLLDIVPDFATAPEPTISLRELLAKMGVGPGVHTFTGKRPQELLNFTFKTSTEDERVALEAFFHARRGRAQSFWVPSWHADLNAPNGIVSGTTELEITPVDYDAYLEYTEEEALGRWIFAYSAEGVLECKQVTAYAAGVLTVADAWVNDFDADNLIVGFVHHVRFDTDTMRGEFVTPDHVEYVLPMLDAIPVESDPDA